MRRRNDPEPQFRNALLRPPEKNTRQKIKSFFWDKDQKTCLTRSPLNWCMISIYYSLFLVGVLLLFYVSMRIAAYVASLNKGRPQYILGDSPIGACPGMNFFPLIENRCLIWLSSSKTFKEYVDAINKEFDNYKKYGFDPSSLGECGEEPYGYANKTPCVFFRLNRLLEWEPGPSKKAEGSFYTDVNYSKNVSVSNTTESDLVLLSCKGVTAKDRDHITEEILKFQGLKGFNKSGFPYKGQKNYVDPIVAVQIVDKSPGKVLYSFKCSAICEGVNPNIASVEVAYYFE